MIHARARMRSPSIPGVGAASASSPWCNSLRACVHRADPSEISQFRMFSPTKNDPSDFCHGLLSHALARHPGVIGTPLHALGQQTLGALGVAGAKAGLEERVVEDVALGPAPADLDDARP